MLNYENMSTSIKHLIILILSYFLYQFHGDNF